MGLLAETGKGSHLGAGQLAHSLVTPSAAQGKTRRPPYVTRVRPQLKGNSGGRCAKVVSEFAEQGTEQFVLKNQVPDADADANV